MSKEEKEEVEIKKTETFTERFVTSAVISHTHEGNFYLDFGRPVVSAYAEKESGKILGIKGELHSDVRLIMSSISAKRVLSALKANIEGYESKYGKIEGGEEESGVSGKE